MRNEPASAMTLANQVKLQSEKLDGPQGKKLPVRTTPNHKKTAVGQNQINFQSPLIPN